MGRASGLYPPGVELKSRYGGQRRGSKVNVVTAFGTHEKLGVPMSALHAGGGAAYRPSLEQVNRSPQGGWAHRLEEIANRARTQRYERAFLTRAHDNDRRRPAGRQPPDQLNSSQYRHLKIQEDQIGCETLDEINRHRAVGCLSDDRDISEFIQFIVEYSPSYRLIVDNQGSDHRLAFCILDDLNCYAKRILINGPEQRSAGYLGQSVDRGLGRQVIWRSARRTFRPRTTHGPA